MKVVVIYRAESDHRRAVEDFVRDYRHTNLPVNLETLDIDTREGSSVAALYDVVNYPAVLVIRDDGTMQKLWQGLDLPLINDIETYLSL